MNKKKLIERLKEIRAGIESDRFTYNNITKLIEKVE